jgi:hypothetical protein
VSTAVSTAVSTEMGTTASITSGTIRRAAPLAFAPALGAYGTMIRMMGCNALAKAGDGRRRLQQCLASRQALRR